jgi:hypothetical protein
MKLRLFNPVVIGFLALVFGIGLVFVLTARPTRSELGQVQVTPVPTSLPELTPVISPTLTVTITVPPPIETRYPTPVPSITIVRTPTLPPPAQTATVEAHLTALTIQYGQIVPNPNPTQSTFEARMFRSLYTRPGAVIAQGSNSTPTGDFNLLTYRVEEVLLSGPTTFHQFFLGGPKTLDRAWRFRITGGPFPPPMNARLELHLNGRVASSSYEQFDDEGTLTFVIIDRSHLQEGARIAIGYFGTVEVGVLPETLHLLP